MQRVPLVVLDLPQVLQEVRGTGRGVDERGVGRGVGARDGAHAGDGQVVGAPTAPRTSLRVHEKLGWTRPRSSVAPDPDIVAALTQRFAQDDVDRAGDRPRAGLRGRRAIDLDPLDHVGRQLVDREAAADALRETVMVGS